MLGRGDVPYMDLFFLYFGPKNLALAMDRIERFDEANRGFGRTI